MKSFPELLKLYEEAMKVEAVNPYSATTILQNIVLDEACPKSLKMTAERALANIQAKTATVAAPVVSESKPPEEKTVLKNRVHMVDAYAIELIDGLTDFMPISDEQYDKLKQAIAKDGIQTPLFVTPDFKLLCGYNRLKIAKEFGFKTVPVIFKDVPSKEILEFAIIDNIARRHMDTKDIAIFLSKVGELAPRGKRTGKKTKTIKEIADLTGVSERTVQRAKKFAKKVKENPEFVTKSIGTVVGEAAEAGTRKSMTFSFTEGLDMTEENISAALATVADEMFDFDLHGGDKVKVAVQLFHIRSR